MIYRVSVREDYRWSDCQVSGRIFSKAEPKEIGEADMNDEIRNSPLLVVEELPEVEQPQQTEGESGPEATKAARELAAEAGIDLADVPATGSGGQITKGDVESFLANGD